MTRKSLDFKIFVETSSSSRSSWLSKQSLQFPMPSLPRCTATEQLCAISRDAAGLGPLLYDFCMALLQSYCCSAGWIITTFSQSRRYFSILISSTESQLRSCDLPHSFNFSPSAWLSLRIPDLWCIASYFQRRHLLCFDALHTEL